MKIHKKVWFGEFWFGLAEVRFGQFWSGLVEFGLVKVGVIWFSLVDPQTNKQNK